MITTIYTTPTCVWCKKTKEFLKKNKVKFKEIDVSSNKKSAQEMIKKSNQTGVPVIDINEEIILGLNESAIKKALKLK